MIFAYRANLTQYFSMPGRAREAHGQKPILLRDVFTLPSKVGAALAAGATGH